MPGIVGMIRPEVPGEAAADLKRMVVSLRHEAFYASGSLASEEDDLSLGWVGVDERASLGMFGQNENTRVVLAGELFGDTRQKADYAQQVIRAYETEGEDCLAGLNGWFTGVIQDRCRKRVLVFNDRYGHGRLYWNHDENGFYFASEAKALLAIRPELRSLDPQGLSEWLSCGCPLQNRTLFTGIQILPPASVWTFQPDGTHQENVYFRPEEWENRETLSADSYLEKLGDILPGVLKRYRTDDRDAAISLTGGLDGRLIMAWGDIPPGDLPCYTFNGPYRECADARIARQIATTCGQSHQVIHMGDDFFDDFADLAAKSVYLSDGTMDVTGAAELYVNRDARKIAPVRLTGNYGSEILREYVAFRARSQTVPGIDPSLCSLIPQAAETYAAEAQGHLLSFIAFKQVPWHHYARSSIERSQLIVRSPYLDNDIVSLAYQAPAGAKTVPALLRLSAEGSPKLGAIPNDRGLSNDGSSAMNRLKRHYHEFMAKAEYAYDYGMPQWLVRADRRLSALHLEKLFLGHQKFCHFRIWYRDRLAETIQEVLLDPSTLDRGLYNRGMVEQMVRQHLNGQGNHTSSIHKLLSLEFIHRVLINEGAAVASPAPVARVLS